MKIQASLRTMLMLVAALGVCFAALGYWLQQPRGDFEIWDHANLDGIYRRIHVNHNTIGVGRARIDSKRLAHQMTGGRHDSIIGGPGTNFGAFLDFPHESGNSALGTRALVFLEPTAGDPYRVITPYGVARFGWVSCGLEQVDRAVCVNFWRRVDPPTVIAGLDVKSNGTSPGTLKLVLDGEIAELQAREGRVRLRLYVGSFDSTWRRETYVKFDSGPACNKALNEGVEFTVKGTRPESYWIDPSIVDSPPGPRDLPMLPICFQFDPTDLNSVPVVYGQ